MSLMKIAEIGDVGLKALVDRVIGCSDDDGDGELIELRESEFGECTFDEVRALIASRGDLLKLDKLGDVVSVGDEEVDDGYDYWVTGEDCYLPERLVIWVGPTAGYVSHHCV